jgi:quercetin dioxygenase-like cupin family protein
MLAEHVLDGLQVGTGVSAGFAARACAGPGNRGATRSARLSAARLGGVRPVRPGPIVGPGVDSRWRLRRSRRARATRGARTVQARGTTPPGDDRQRCQPYRHPLLRPREAAMIVSEDCSSGAGGRAVEQAPGLWRTDLQQHDLSVPGRQVVQARVDIGPEAPPVRHTHPGEEIIYILEGSLEYQIEGQPPKTFNAGDALTVPAGAIHAVRNVGSNAAELATYVVEKGKPLLTLAE